MHSNERERLILEALAATGFVSYRALEARLGASPATIRRDLTRLDAQGRIARVHGGAMLAENPPQLLGTPFDQSITLNLAAKQAIGRAAAALCGPGEGVMIDGGTTTLQMCTHLAGLGCQVLTNSLHIVNALLPQPDTRILLPSGSLFREHSMPRFHAPKLFMGAAAVGPQGVMQTDVILVAAERRLIDRAEQVVLLVDSSKFESGSGAIVCSLDEVDVLITDAGIPEAMRSALDKANVRLIITN